MEGYRFIARNQILLLIAISSVIVSVSGGILGGMIALFAIGEIGIQPGPFGIIIGIGGASSFVGAIYTTRVTRKLGVGPTMALGLFIYGSVSFFMPLAPTEIWLAMVFFVIPQVFGDGFWIMHDINEASVQQAVTPEHLRGRVASALKVSEKTGMLIGASIAGIVAELVGLRIALATGSAIFMLAGVVLLHPTIRSMKTIPQSPGDSAKSGESGESGESGGTDGTDSN